MSLRKKIIITFFISAFIIAILATFEYVNFIRVRSEMRFLEVSDSVRSRTLELRRHEKNFFLFPDKAYEEAAAMRDYLGQLDQITEEVRSHDPQKADSLEELIATYRTSFLTIESRLGQISTGLEGIEASLEPYRGLSQLLEATYRDKPLYVAEFLTDEISLPPSHQLVKDLVELDGEIGTLRATGEDLITAANDLDQDARENADSGIRQSQAAIIIFVPLFLVIGLGALVLVSTSVVRRLNTLSEGVERIGERYVGGQQEVGEEGRKQDEVDALIGKFGRMNDRLIDWERELREKNEELLQSKKLAAIGTLASGVAHELNNPLNNINLSAEVLKRQLGDDAQPETRDIIDDIVGQTARVKGIVGNLLEFAREREPQVAEVELNGLLRSAYSQVRGTLDTSRIDFVLDSDPEGVSLMADPNQLEQVFVNLFANAVAAMDGNGKLVVKVEPEDESLSIWVSDTGKGIAEGDREKVFDPFFTRKDKGTGLGLAIVMNIVRRHGGEISLASEEDMGTVFRIDLPRGGG